MTRIAVLAPAAAVLLAACGPMPVERAERECFNRAYLATKAEKSGHLL